ncbi:Hypothetical predicted protein [Cloeon dipterum]|uniref:Tetraspanin n=1 Tax=Cloeon dipterum TaxID=197152 RepID=A0A8S1CN13_9INSE|nr:Hypothetical predicted protein [Cloeon dipterum]
MAKELNCAESTIKYILFVFNVLFLIGGIVLLTLAGIILAQIATYDSFFDDPFATPGIILVSSGALIVITGFLGCFGAIKQSFWMLLGFAGFMTLIFVLQLVGGILAFTFQEKLDSFLEENLLEQMKLYGNPEVGDGPKITWDTLQSNFQCCGIDTYSDWTLYTVLATPPESCNCNPNDDSICNPLSYYKDGCIDDLKGFFISLQIALGAVGICFAVAEIIGIVFAIFVALAIRRKENESIYVTRISARPKSSFD